MRPFRSSIVVTRAGALRRGDEHQAGKSQHRDERDELAALGGHLNRVIVEARHDVGAAADQRLQRLRAAGEILQLDVEPFVAIEPELLRERRRQVDHLVLPADRDPHVARHRWTVAHERDARDNRHRGHRRTRTGTHRRTSCPCVLVVVVMLSIAAAIAPAASRRRSTITTTMPSTVMPAKTPVVSNVPSACEIT